jgi:hypothetical protein
MVRDSSHSPKEENDMNYYKQQFYCGIDMSAKSMHACLVDQAGEERLHRNSAELIQAETSP